jgi:hypothetical protein
MTGIRGTSTFASAGFLPVWHLLSDLILEIRRRGDVIPPAEPSLRQDGGLRVDEVNWSYWLPSASPLPLKNLPVSVAIALSLEMP